MPPVSQAQRKAMWAAAEGKSTIGIPKKVGAEYAKADTGGKLPARVKHKDGHHRVSGHSGAHRIGRR